MDDILRYLTDKGTDIMNKQNVSNTLDYLTRTEYGKLPKDDINLGTRQQQFDKFYHELVTIFKYSEYLKTITF